MNRFSLLRGAVGLAIWVPSVTNQAKDSKASDARSSVRSGYASLSLADDKDDGGDLELSVIENGADIQALVKLLEKLEV
nr:isoform 2 of chloride channel protein clc-f [Quercus suber]